MVINFADILNSILQSIFFVYVIDYCVEEDCKKSTLQKISAIIMLFLLMFLLELMFGNLSICIFVIHSLELIVVNFVLYKKRFYSCLITYTILYFFIAFNVNIFGNLFFGFFKNRVILNNRDLLMVLTIYIPQFIMGILILKYKDKIKSIHDKILLIQPSIIILIIINCSIDFIAAFYLIFYKNESELLRNLVSVTFMLFLAIIITYFIKIDIKSHKILELNKSLYDKNIELTTVQNSYSKEITYMYDLYCMKRIDKIGEKLKDIINKNNVENNVNLNEDSTLIKNIVKKINSENINVIIEDDGELDNLTIPELELYRIISNIVNNAVKAMSGNGILIIKTYNNNYNVIIIIENNGPKIEEENIYKIFESGFTTKNNTEKNHGYGLSIVKELVEKYNGTINLTSDDISTKFRISLPLN
ncbi:ATP-binding protein [Clostridium botulinum]|uniref:histidine kinase n=1 Tax=Clostridium botulinum TaxID=1491 RepID=A0A6M0STT7_CLOBO|nr:ATP-binding protein [Clostridium botulinum]